MAEVKIICPICDEEFGDRIEDVPEKCPVCDTRKHEILQTINDLQQGNQKPTTFIVDNTIQEAVVPTAQENKSSKRVVIEEEVQENREEIQPKDEESRIIIQEEMPSIEKKEETTQKNAVQEEDSQDNIIVDDSASPETEDETQIASEPEATEQETGKHEASLPKQKYHPDTAIVAPPKYIEERQESSPMETANVVFNKSSEENEDVVFEKKDKEEDVVFDTQSSAPEGDVVFDGQSSKDEQSSQNLSAEMEKQPPPPPKAGMTKSGASTLEILPLGFKYCASCGDIYPKEYEKNICRCSGRSPLQTVAKGFPPGHYIILYNDVNKAITYFRLEAEGSIFLGRSSERGSPKDIDLSIAWKNFYQKHNAGPEDFKQKMGLIKGVSRKHALVRFSQEDKKYVLFHLSEKNYTIIHWPNGDKRTRAPKNRAKIELQSGTRILLGNQREFIVLGYKVLS